jgi:large subunit ribosomal protein L22
MRTRSFSRFVRVPPRKARLVLDRIRGQAVGDALAILRGTPRAAARLVEKVLRSAVANAEHNHQVRSLDELWVVEAVADEGPSMKRVQPRAMGRAFFIKHRTSHLRISVSDEAAARVAPQRRAVGSAARRPGEPRTPARETR